MTAIKSLIRESAVVDLYIIASTFIRPRTMVLLCLLAGACVTGGVMLAHVLIGDPPPTLQPSLQCPPPTMERFAPAKLVM